MKIPLMRHTFAHESETLQALSAWLATEPTKLSMGELCAEFERQFATWQGRKYAVLFNSGGSANLALMQSLRNMRFGFREGVGFSALTWSTNVDPILQMGYHAIPLDIDPCTLNTMSGEVEKHRKNIDALFITNALGYLPDLDRIRDICDGSNVLLFEDNCESLGSSLPSGKAGNFGLASTFSFFVAHHMSTIEGGMVCTDHAEIAEMLIMTRANGWDRNLSDERKAYQRRKYDVIPFQAAYTFYVRGFNLRPTEITGFLGLQQLGHLDQALAERAAIFSQLESAARANPDFTYLNHDHQSALSPFCFPLVCQTPRHRWEYIQRFQRAGVEVRPIIAGNIAHQPFYRYEQYAKKELPGADKVETCGFYFGVYPELTPDEITLLQELLCRPLAS